MREREKGSHLVNPLFGSPKGESERSRGKGRGIIAQDEFSPPAKSETSAAKICALTSEKAG